MKIEYISIGPTCISAEILKAAGLRHCTYGFDWCRSGYYHLQQFIELPLVEFIHGFALRPSVALEQVCNPYETSSSTAELRRVENLYGFPYLYFPHRPEGTRETREYIWRCFTRLNKVIWREEVRKVFVVSDYVNKPHYGFIAEEEVVAQKLSSLVRDNRINAEIAMIRVELVGNDCSLEMDTYRLASGKCTVIRARVPQDMDSEEIRAYTYRYIGRGLATVFR
ncbi:hypothetical protein CWE16_01960 [Synechococcus sp. BS55D]|nr:hypothetical protein CWE16_01960 [Synechococcus sp. BS55D]